MDFHFILCESYSLIQTVYLIKYQLFSNVLRMDDDRPLVTYEWHYLSTPLTGHRLAKGLFLGVERMPQGEPRLSEDMRISKSYLHDQA